MADRLALAADFRAAAKALRERAADATPAPWTLYDRGVCWEIDQLDEHDGTSFRKGDAHWIAMMSPDIAEPMARLLDEFAHTAELFRHVQPIGWEHALEIVRQLVGEQPPG